MFNVTGSQFTRVVGTALQQSPHLDSGSVTFLDSSAVWVRAGESSNASALPDETVAMKKGLCGSNMKTKQTTEEPMKPVRKLARSILAATLIVLGFTEAGSSNTRTLETRFSLSSDVRSEFSTQFPLLSEGRILIEAAWTASHAAAASASLTLVLIQPDGTEATRRTGGSILRFEHRVAAQDIERFVRANRTKWTVKVLNGSDANRREVSGTLRITVPAESRALEDTQFTLLGSGNAQEIPFNIPAPGRVEVEVSWQPDVVSTPPAAQIPLTVSFIHPGESRTYARRQGASPVRFDHQITDGALDRGARWIVRVQNDRQTKVKGRVRITYTPSL